MSSKEQQPSQNRPQQAAHHFTQADLNRLVLDYLNKKGYHQTEATLRIESTKIPGQPTIPLTTGNSNFSKPAPAVSDRSNLQFQQQQFIQQQKASRQRQYDEDPKMFGRAYSMFRTWCENSLEMYKYELNKFLYPLFVYMFLSLIQRGDSGESRTFYEKFKHDHLLRHGYEVRTLGGIALPEHIEQNQVAKIFKYNKYRIYVSTTSMNLVLGFLNENQGVGGGILVRTINNNMEIVTQTEVTTAAQDETEAIENAEGIPAIYQLLNSGKETAAEEKQKEKDRANPEFLNSKSLKLGKFPGDPEFNKEVEAELKQKDDAEVEKNGDNSVEKSLIDEFNENFTNETAAADDVPGKEVLPLPQKTLFDLKREIIKVQDSRSKIRLNAVQAHLPSVCMYTFHNTNNDMTCAEFNDDSTMIASGFQDSFIKLWSIDGSPLRSVLKHDELNETVDGLAVSTSRRLVGHSGAVYGLDFSPDNHYLLSASEDKTVRLWSTDTYSALVSYKGHNAPVWDVKFSPLGHYFATASHDQTARLWSCDHIYPLRIFAGHLNDVDVVEFHPNSTYLFTGSSDRTVRMWDIARGESVRVFIGHTMPINALACSPDGRWLATAGEDSVINLFDIASGRKLKSMRGHGRGSIYSLSFSVDGSVLVSGGSDNSIRVWDVKRGTMDNNNPRPEKFTYESVINAKNSDETTRTDNLPGDHKSNGTGNTTEELKRRREFVATQDHLAVYFTKKTPVYKVHFTRRNLCLAAGVYMG
ncbi:DEKNAAC104892 [Brettanomyces naardenensis]|uniref:DEKNAAC104892 n=1 Tax=Brettanomyces naardenensis TaxID=13370 RepID=A0A448YS10_BRENA|nr:DEKNAAC104892 [Brettanomyces naardenensis]